ncbi:MAG TPA: alpha/beta fold hydrolase, partial [Bacteroidia bacterium]
IGMFLLPPPPKEQYKEPSYAKTSAITERDITVKTGEYSLPGILTLPKEGKKIPLVILIHGSGPNDMDETVGPNKVFKDLALGLASNGIAVLRYNKRTHDYGAKMMEHVNELTVKEEILEDAMSALQLAKTFPEIDTNKIFFLGHSEGAMVMPRLADGRKDIAGIIMMAGNARPLEDLILEQTTYLLGLDGFTKEDKDALAKVKMQVMEVKRPALSDTVSASRLPLNCPARYWMDLRNYHQVEVAEKLKLPMLIMQGERDYQVTMEDYKIWQEHLYKRKNVTLHSYPKLNHLFQEGDAPKSTPKEYERQVNVPEYVIKDISDFIKKH